MPVASEAASIIAEQPVAQEPQPETEAVVTAAKPAAEVAAEAVAETPAAPEAQAPAAASTGRAPNDPREVRRRQREAERLARLGY